MIVTRISDGLGNQLFMYACGFAVAKRNCTDLVLDTSILDTSTLRKFELSNLNIAYKKIHSVSRFKSKIMKIVARKVQSIYLFRNLNRYEEHKNGLFDDGVLHISDNTYISGYWQSEKYFAEYRSDLLKLLIPKDERSVSVKNLYDEMKKCSSIALHVRRGDYLGIGCYLNMNYYDQAISMMKSKYPEEKLILYVFSDDIDFCKKYFAEKEGFAANGIELRYPQYESDNYTLDDMFLMSHCKHMIMANSSYSWWAAWLNQNEEKTVICPELGMWRGDFYPDDWIKIQCEE